MEHSWGRGIHTYGLQSSGCTLAARDALFGNVVYTNEFIPFPRRRYWLIPLGDDQVYVPIEYDASGTWNQPFPYGANVQPDVPL